MKKLYLVHGWGGSDSSEGWFGWLKEEGKKRGFEVISFNMPNTDEPKIDEWVGFLKENVKEIDEETYFIGHSVGCQAIIRFLENLPEKTKIGGCIFVAGWFNLKEETYEEDGEEAREIAKPWIETLIDFEKVKTYTNNFLAIFSDNDPYVPLSDANLFRENLGGEIIVKHNEGHFNETKDIKEIFKVIK
jgi:hypothetical protein